MKVILNKLLTLCLFLASIGCFYLAITRTFISSFFNFALFFVAIFFLIQACGMVDKTQGYGQYSNENNKETEVEQDEKEKPLGQPTENENDNEIVSEDDDYSDYD